MNFERWVEELYSRRRTESAERSFAIFEEACALFDDPQKAFKAIHVGGTNGKGSVAYGAYDQLRRRGLKAGLFTSPHFLCPTERIEVEGLRISKERLQEIGSAVLDSCDQLHFFSWITLVALIYFRERGIEWGVFEVGLGGKYDPTRVVLSEVAVVTSLGFDHAEILGDTLEKIAESKRAILREEASHILGPTASAWIDTPKAQHIGAQASVTEENSALVRAVMHSIGYGALEPIASPPGRFERVGEDIVIDVAHNPEGFMKLTEMLEGEHWQALVALSKDKDIAGCLKPLLGKVDCFHLVCFDGARAHFPGDLMRSVGSVECICYGSLSAAFEGWLEAGGKRLVCGSFCLVGPAMELLNQKGLRTSLSVPQPV